MFFVYFYPVATPFVIFILEDPVLTPQSHLDHSVTSHWSLCVYSVGISDRAQCLYKQVYTK